MYHVRRTLYRFGIWFKVFKYFWIALKSSKLTLQQILLAVNTIHEERIVHSDLKPANFLLVRGSLKLIDFGIAKAIMCDTTNIQRDSQVFRSLSLRFTWNASDCPTSTSKRIVYCREEDKHIVISNINFIPSFLVYVNSYTGGYFKLHVPWSFYV